MWARWAHSPTSELQKAVCGWGGTQVQARLGAVSHSSNRMPEAMGAKGAMVRSVGGGGFRGPPAQLIHIPGQASHPTLHHTPPHTHSGDFKGLGDLRTQESLGG